MASWTEFALRRSRRPTREKQEVQLQQALTAMRAHGVSAETERAAERTLVGVLVDTGAIKMLQPTPRTRSPLSYR